MKGNNKSKNAKKQQKMTYFDDFDTTVLSTIFEKSTFFAFFYVFSLSIRLWYSKKRKKSEKKIKKMYFFSIFSFYAWYKAHYNVL